MVLIFLKAKVNTFLKFTEKYLLFLISVIKFVEKIVAHILNNLWEDDCSHVSTGKLIAIWVAKIQIFRHLVEAEWPM